jgi:hypothetical protein
MEPSKRLWITRVRKRHARPVDDAGLYQRIAADVNDLEFLNRFQRGLKYVYFPDPSLLNGAAELL